MARIVTNQTNFTGGELSPRMKGRTDVQRYQNGADTIENGRVVVQGGVVRRDGTRYLGTGVYGGNRPMRLIPYVYSTDQSFVLEFGHLYVRAFDARTGARLLNADLSILSLVTPYADDQLDEISYCQDADKLYLHHPEFATRVLRRLSATVWTFGPLRYVAEPFAELGHTPDRRLTIDNPATGSGRTMVASNITTPGAPTGLVAVGRNGGAFVTLNPPADTGGAAIDSYVITASPGGASVTTVANYGQITGLSNGTSYTFTAKAHNKGGYGADSAPSNAIVPDASMPPASIHCTATPLHQYSLVHNGTVTIDGPTASASGGKGPYRYKWTKRPGGDSDLTIDTGNQAKLRVTSTGYGSANFATFRCTATDANGVTGLVDVTVSVKHESANPKQQREME